MGISFFSHRATRMVESYTGPMEPPVDPDEARDEAIFDAIEAIWADAEWLEAACAYDNILASPELCRRLVALRPWIEKEPESMDGDYRACLRELIQCVDREVYKAAVRRVDDGFDDLPGDAA